MGESSREAFYLLFSAEGIPIGIDAETKTNKYSRWLNLTVATTMYKITITVTTIIYKTTITTINKTITTINN